jgi:hypothetical protein
MHAMLTTYPKKKFIFNNNKNLHWNHLSLFGDFLGNFWGFSGSLGWFNFLDWGDGLGGGDWGGGFGTFLVVNGFDWGDGFG